MKAPPCDHAWAGFLFSSWCPWQGYIRTYVSWKEHAIVNTHLYLPGEWARDRTRHERALEMLDEPGSLLPHAWVAGDDEMGMSSGFRRESAGRGER